MDEVTFTDTLAALVGGETLDRPTSAALFTLVLEGRLSEAQLAGLLMALASKGEAVSELVGAIDALRAAMLPITAPVGAIDVCGTGGDRSGSLNISTAVAFVVAGAGVPVAKHGNRAQTSQAGAADTIEALGVNLDADFALLEQALAEAGTAFLMAPRHHPALRHVVSVRRQLAVRTIFNLLGPLANPASVKRQLVGVFAPERSQSIAQALQELGSEAAWVVHGDGLDELSIAGESQVTVLKEGSIHRQSVHPELAGLPLHPLEAISGGTAAYNQAALTALLAGSPGAYRDAVLLNAAAALCLADQAADLREGAARAAESIDSGAANRACTRLVEISQQSRPRA